MRTFPDSDGTEWTASVRELAGPDYKGRYFLVLTGANGEEAELIDVRWNAERTARRTLETIGETELRRRLRSAVGRGPAQDLQT